MPNIQSILIAFAIGFLMGAIPAGVGVYKYEEASWTAALSKQKQEAAATLQVETEKVLAGEREQSRLNNLLEKNHADANKKIDVALADNRRLSRELGGLRDPGRRTNCDGAKAGAQLAANPGAAATGGELSTEASDFLLEFAADADRAAEYAQTCHSWAQGAAGLKK